MSTTILKPAAPAAASRYAYPWTPDQGDGLYSNPVLYADYSDPDVIRVGNDFYLTASSFQCTPGLPILHSRDLVNWALINHALKNLPHPRYAQVQPGCGVWAPALRFHAGRFWIFFPTPDEGIYVTTADDPAGKWTEPHLVHAGRGLIDPCPLWDEDGQAYLVHAYAGSRAGIKHRLRVCPLAPDGSRLLGEGQVVFHEPQRHPTLEGPKFLKKDGWYYILAPAGGVESGWQIALRSRHIYGPYADKVVLEQGVTPVNGPHQGALVDAPGGEWWFLHFQDAGVYGRIVHLQPVTWTDGWPLMGRDQDGNGIGEPVAQFRKPLLSVGDPIAIPQTSDEFDSPALGLQWQWHANHQDQWYSLTARPGWLRLFPPATHESDLGRAPNLLLQKFPARAFAAEAALDLSLAHDGAEAGLVVMGRHYAALAVQRTGGQYRIGIRQNDGIEVLKTCSSRLRLRVQVEDGGECSFSFGEPSGQFTSVPERFQAHPGVWIGAKLGLYHLGAGHADFDYFRFQGVSS